MRPWRTVFAAGLLCGIAGGSLAAAVSTDTVPEAATKARQEAEQLDKMPPVRPAPAGPVDHSGRKESGRASFYARRFTRRRMADGHRMNPNASIAASRTLPLGSVVKVTNLGNGKTATVKIEDHGPFAKDRVVDLSPRVARQLDLTHQGVTAVELRPVTVPLPDGGVKLGAGAADESPEAVDQAVEETKQLTEPASR